MGQNEREVANRIGQRNRNRSKLKEGEQSFYFLMDLDLGLPNILLVRSKIFEVKLMRMDKCQLTTGVRHLIKKFLSRNRVPKRNYLGISFKAIGITSYLLIFLSRI